MSGRFVRASKYRHVFGQKSKKELCYENLKITKNAWDSNLIKANGKYLAVNWDASGGGAFAVIPVNEIGKAPDQVPLFRGHTAAVLDTDFDPFDDSVLVSSSDDGKISVWEIPEEYSFHKYVGADDVILDVKPVKQLSGHTRKVGHVKFHPLAKNVLASSSLDYSVKLWNVETGKDIITLQHKDLVTSFAFNYNGSLMATVSRDKKIRIWDIRKGEVISEGPGHSGAKSSRVAWLGKTNRIVTTGFSRLSDRQIGIWNTEDIAAGAIGGFYVVDSSSGILIPIFDDSTSILFVAGKGDGNIRYYEFADDELYDLSEFQSTDAQRGFAVAPKHSVNVRENEVVKAYKTVADNYIEPISFIVPRRAEMFQSDIYPDAPSQKPALTAEEWFSGKEVNGPVLMSMESLYDGSEPTFSESSAPVAASKKAEVKEEKSTPTPAPAPVETREVTPSYSKPKSQVDDLLNKKEVDALLQKASDLDDQNDVKETNDTWDDDYVEVSPKTASVEEKSPEPVAAPKVIKTEPVAKEEPKKVEPVVKEEPKKLEPTVIAEPAPVQTKEVTPEAKAPTSEPASSPSTVTSKAPTLKATVEKLASLVEKLEAQITTLADSGLEKDERLKALEHRIDELLKR